MGILQTEGLQFCSSLRDLCNIHMSHHLVKEGVFVVILDAYLHSEMSKKPATVTLSIEQIEGLIILLLYYQVALLFRANILGYPDSTIIHHWRYTYQKQLYSVFCGSENNPNDVIIRVDLDTANLTRP